MLGRSRFTIYHGHTEHAAAAEPRAAHGGIGPAHTTHRTICTHGGIGAAHAAHRTICTHATYAAAGCSKR